MRRIKGLVAGVFAGSFLMACSSSPINKYSKEEKSVFLDTLGANIHICVDDVTSIHHRVSKEFIILTRYWLNEEETAELEATGYLKNNLDGMENFVDYEIIAYELINERNQRLEFVEGGRENHLQITSLGEENGRSYQKLFALEELNGSFEQLSGYVKIRLKIPKNIIREVDMAVSISITDSEKGFR